MKERIEKGGEEAGGKRGGGRIREKRSGKERRIKMTPLTGCTQVQGSMCIWSRWVWYLLLITTWHPLVNTTHSRPHHHTHTGLPLSARTAQHGHRSSLNSSIWLLITGMHTTPESNGNCRLICRIYFQARNWCGWWVLLPRNISN